MHITELVERFGIEKMRMLIEALEAYEGSYTSSGEYQFNWKMNFIEVPKEVKRLENFIEIYQQVLKKEAVDFMAKIEVKYHWIRKIYVAGRLDGYLIIGQKETNLKEEAMEIVNDAEQIIGELEDGDTVNNSRIESTIEEVGIMINTLICRLNDIREIRKMLKEDMDDLAQRLESHDFWEDQLEAK